MSILYKPLQGITQLLSVVSIMCYYFQFVCIRTFHL